MTCWVVCWAEHPADGAGGLPAWGGRERQVTASPIQYRCDKLRRIRNEARAPFSPAGCDNQSILDGVHTMNFESLFSGIFEQIMATITDMLSRLCEGGLAELFGGLMG